MDENDLNLNLRYTINKPKKMGFNFTVRPTSNLSNSYGSNQRLESQIKLDRYLAKIRKKRRHL